jgi:hypothetical protein
MRNYGFDYLIEKTQLLTEMPSGVKNTFWSDNFPEFEQLYKEVQRKMKQHPKAPLTSAALTIKRMEYVTMALFDSLSKEELATIGIDKSKGFSNSVYNLAYRVLTPVERVGDKRTRVQTPGYAKFAPKNADNSKLQQEYMLIKMVEAYPEKATSKQFAKKLLDDGNIDKFMSIQKTGTSNFAYGITKKKEKMLGISMEEAYEVHNKAKSIIKKLRNSKRLPKGIRTSIHHADNNFIQEEPDTNNENTPLTIFRDTLKELLAYRQRAITKLINTDNDEEMRGVGLDVQENIRYERNLLTDTDKSVFDNMLKNVEISINSNQNITDEQIQKLILKIMGNVGGLVLKYYKRNLKTSTYQNDAEILLKKDRYQSVYDTLDDGLLDSLVDEGIITNEESELLAKWRDISSSLQQSIVTKSSRDANKAAEAQSREDVRNIRQGEYEKRAKEWEAKKQSNKKGVKKPKIDDDDDELSDSEDEDDSYNYDEDEEGVMNYMTEQIRKDSHSNIIGEYKDRGFKKTKNYAYWTF